VVHQSPAGQVAVSFAQLLRQFRIEARLTQEELAEKAGLSSRSISDLERGISRTARKETAWLLADALALTGSLRTAFVATARGRAPAAEVPDARESGTAEMLADRMVWYAFADDGLSLHKAVIMRLIEAVTAAVASEAGTITGIWVVGATARAGDEPASALLGRSAGADGSKVSCAAGVSRICVHSCGRRRVVDSGADADSELGALPARPRQRPTQGLGRCSIRGDQS
jgi:transcriptional regulator with XRE-family HTH domain